MIHFLEGRSDYLSMGEYLASWGKSLADRISIVNYEELPRRSSLQPGTYVFADIDQLTQGGARLARELEAQLVEKGARVLNSPSRTLLRLELLEELHRSGSNAFRAVRAVDGYRSLRFPVFVREEHAHNGALTPLLRTPAEVEAGLGSAIARGRRLEDLLVVEFCDTADADGFYRKYGAFVVGREIIPRHLNYGRSWMLKQRGTEFSEAMVREEHDYVVENPHERELSRVARIARVEYGRIDYAWKDGAVQVWEINLTPTIGVGMRPRRSSIPPEFREMRQRTKEHFYRLFEAAWIAVDSAVEGSAPISIRYSGETVRRAQRMMRAQGSSRFARALRRRLRPLSPLAARLGEALSPILVKLARIRARKGAAA